MDINLSHELDMLLNRKYQLHARESWLIKELFNRSSLLEYLQARLRSERFYNTLELRKLPTPLNQYHHHRSIHLERLLAQGRKEERSNQVQFWNDLHSLKKELIEVKDKLSSLKALLG